MATAPSHSVKPPENKMGVQPVGRLLAGMAVPMMISMLVQALYNIVDSIFVARLSENALTAVSLAFPLQNLMIAVCAGTTVGMNALLSRSLGAKEQDKADQAANTGIFLAFSFPTRFSVSKPTWRRSWTTAPATAGSAWAVPSACSANSRLSVCSNPPAGPISPCAPRCWAPC